MHVVGTAGHVDHGKSSLVRALTGIDPDRLKEEKAREMTIDLGFAWLTLPGGDVIGIIDVPGHRDFIENMLAGVGGIDAVIFVVAADEGAMPQTREHLAIIDLLRIPAGVVALTKIDLAPDADWLELVQLELSEVMRGTVLENAPVFPVSARTGEGLDGLQAAIVNMLGQQPPARDIGRPRLWVDRVFSVSGFGTVVTGTLVDGQLTLGQEIELQPGGLRGRVRGLQTHGKALEVALPGSRVAVNIGGVDKSDVRRGHLLTLPGSVTPTRLIAVQFRHLPDAPRPLRHNAEVKFFCGAAETVATARVLDAEVLMPGAEGWLQLELREPLPLLKEDRFILRYPSPGTTIGGGTVIDPAPGRRWRRNRPEVIARLETLARGEPSEIVAQALEVHGKPLKAAQIAEITGLDDALITGALATAAERQTVYPLVDGWWIGEKALAALLERITRRVATLHKHEPLRAGLRPEILRGPLALEAAELDALLDVAVERGAIVRGPKGVLALPDHSVQFNRVQRISIDRLMAAFAAAPYTPPSAKESAAIVGEDVLAALVEQGQLRQVSPDVLLVPAVFEEFAAETRRSLAERGRIDVKTLRDRFNTSRKYALAVLEHFDGLNITRRDGDDHIPSSGDWSRLG